MSIKEIYILAMKQSQQQEKNPFKQNTILH